VAHEAGDRCSPCDGFAFDLLANLFRSGDERRVIVGRGDASFDRLADFLGDAAAGQLGDEAQLRMQLLVDADRDGTEPLFRLLYVLGLRVPRSLQGV
jgi:hypothetical protein